VRRARQRRLRFLDEAGVNLAMTRLYGRAPRGERVRESVPRNYGAPTSVIGTPGLAGPEAVWTAGGAVDTEVFNVYVERVLRPAISRGDIPVLDDLRAIQASCVEAVAAQCGAQAIWLAPYSPDSSPIELMWSKIKAGPRAAKARTREELERALDAALELVTDADCLDWFKHCGYQVASNRN
jgi:transposase